MKKTLFTAALVAGSFLVGSAVSAEAGADRYSWHIPTQPCASEGSNNCFWDAGRVGSGHGDSYWVGRGGNVHYLNPRLGR